MKMHQKVENKLNRCVNHMRTDFAEVVKGCVEAAAPYRQMGKVSAIDCGVIRIGGLGHSARIGDRIKIEGASGSVGEIIAIADGDVLAMADSSLTGLSPGDRAYLFSAGGIRPCRAWIGETLSANGRFFDGRPTPNGARLMDLNPASLSATERRGLGPRLNTGFAALDTFLPICKGQRIGLFAGAGIGKSSLIGELAKSVNADIAVIALIGERSREVGEFVNETMDAEGRSRAVIFASTCDDPAPTKRRGALSAIATAEYFRDQGLHVLLLFDSITRFADAHREIALTAGETPSLRAYPPSTFREIASLAERTGPGVEGVGDITAIFSVLVAGSDMDEPVADMVKSILDGHVILDRDIAERGRYPAINVRRSISRSLPKSASAEENKLLLEARKLIASYEDAAAMIQTGLYISGSDPAIDRAVKVWPKLDDFTTQRASTCEESYQKLRSILASA